MDEVATGCTVGLYGSQVGFPAFCFAEVVYNIFGNNSLLRLNQMCLTLSK